VIQKNNRLSKKLFLIELKKNANDKSN